MRNIKQTKQKVIFPWNHHLLLLFFQLPVLFFFHGKQGTAWEYANIETNWIALAEKEQFIVVFGQSQGEDNFCVISLKI